MILDNENENLKVHEWISKNMLYELTYEVVKVIDPNFWLSEEEYLKIRIE